MAKWGEEGQAGGRSGRRWAVPVPFSPPPVGTASLLAREGMKLMGVDETNRCG